MKFRRLSAALAVAASGALLLSSCAPGGDAPPPEKAAEGQKFTVEPTNSGLADLGDVETQDGVVYVTVGSTEFSSYNAMTPQTYNTYTTTPMDRVLSGFVYFGTDGEIYNNEEFGNFEVESEDPLKVKYTINEDAKWSDGTDITAADVIFSWGFQNPRITDDKDKPLFNSVSTTWGEYVVEAPEGDANGKELTMTFKEPNPDWRLLVSGIMPAHVVAKQADMSLDELIEAVKAEDGEKLAEAAKFWNSGWQTKPGTLPDEELIPSSGPYKLKSWDAGQSLTLTANENYWGTKPGIKEITFRFVEDDAHVQALRNGDLDAVQAHATKDTLDQLNGLDNMIVHQFDQMTWEHLDYNHANGPFADNLELRKAFAMCVPRQSIVDSLIKPLNPDAVVANAREILPFQQGYEDLVKETYEGQYDEVNIEEAKKILEEQDAVGTKVRLAYSSPNPRRTDTVAAIKASCDEAGFKVEDAGSSTFFQPGGEQEKGDYEVALFAWAGSGQIASGANIYQTQAGGKGQQNFNGYSNEEVDKAWDTLQSTLDEEVHKEQRIIIEKALWEDLHGIPLYAHPGVAASNANLMNVRPTATQNQLFWNMEQWQRAE